MFKKRQQTNYLDMVPVRNVKEFTEETDGKITLLIPKFKSTWMTRWLIPPRRSKHFRIHLDETGSSVWRLIDGKRNAGEICELVFQNKAETGQPVDEPELRLTKFLSHLYKSRFIVFK
ncbi:MAG: PqqD family protein [Bacteroidales bacterium]|nr:PqqD family protein [Bacteroidales bacterium]